MPNASPFAGSPNHQVHASIQVTNSLSFQLESYEGAGGRCDVLVRYSEARVSSSWVRTAEEVTPLPTYAGLLYLALEEARRS